MSLKLASGCADSREIGRVAVVHEWLATDAGSEKTFVEIAKAFPDADLYCLSAEPDIELDGLPTSFKTTLLDKRVFRANRALSLPLMPLAWRLLRREPYDLVITSSHAFSRWFHRRSDGPHLSYVYAPMRYAWTPEIDGRSEALPSPLDALGRAAARRVDRASVDSVSSFATISTAVAQRVRSFYGRESQIIPPPVDVDAFTAYDGPRRRGYLITGGRLIPYKNYELAIDTAAELGKELRVFGAGPHRLALEDYAAVRGADITFVGKVDEGELVRLLGAADAFLFPAIEDFGIVAVEALAAGTPVVGIGFGGAPDIKGDTDVVELSESQRPEEFVAAAGRLLDRRCSVDACRARADWYGREPFRERVESWVTQSAAA